MIQVFEYTSLCTKISDAVQKVAYFALFLLTWFIPLHRKESAEAACPARRKLWEKSCNGVFSNFNKLAVSEKGAFQIILQDMACSSSNGDFELNPFREV